MLSVTCIAPVNIAVIKYWGKRDENLILPLNDSLSATLSTEDLCSKTTITACENYAENKITLNGKEESFDNKRLLRCLDEIKQRAKSLSSCALNVLEWKINIVSENNFPTAAGLASSASGYACLVYSLACLYGCEKTDLSGIARLGSGSACRSIYGGFVKWCKGEDANGSDSVAVQIAPTSHWPEMRIIILVVNDRKKTTSSTGGMQRSVETSDLLKYRVESCVPERTKRITEAILAKDFASFAKITMQDSNQFHAICLDTYPPCLYMNDVSHAIANVVHKYNSIKKDVKVAYTFDAGPNACIYLLDTFVPEFISVINYLFPNKSVDAVEYIKGIPIQPNTLCEELKVALDVQPIGEDLLKYIISTKVGDGPKRI